MIGVWGNGGTWDDTQRWAESVIGMAPIRTMRQVYLMWCYALLGAGVLAKGPPGLGVVGIVGVEGIVGVGGVVGVGGGGVSMGGRGVDGRDVDSNPGANRLRPPTPQRGGV